MWVGKECRYREKALECVKQHVSWHTEFLERDGKLTELKQQNPNPLFRFHLYENDYNAPSDSNGQSAASDGASPGGRDVTAPLATARGGENIVQAQKLDDTSPFLAEPIFPYTGPILLRGFWLL